MKICYVTSVDTTIKFILQSQLKFLQQEGYDISVVCSLGKWKADIEREGIKVKDIKFKRKISPISDVFRLVELFFYFKKEKFDIVHTHTPKAGLIGQLAAKMAGVPVIVNTIHGFYFQKNDAWLKRTFFIVIEKIAATCSSLVFFVNKEDIQTAVEEKICPPDVMKYFGGGINVEKFDSKRFSDAFIMEKKREFSIRQNHIIIGIVARLVKEKGYADLFCAFEQILRHHPDTTLLVVGSLEPEKRDAIDPAMIKKYQIEKNIIFLGEKTNVDEIFAMMDIFVLPSYREGLGISILEASAMEKPVVATNIRGCREAVDDGVTGVLVPVKDPIQLAKAIKFFIENSGAAKEMGHKGRLKVIREFDEKLAFQKLQQAYSHLLQI